ncbi:MAG: AAA family ATPase [Lachnospiraceae bacterium]|nr:AAA family ATPase [Lachnospiraceae bacterium]
MAKDTEYLREEKHLKECVGIIRKNIAVYEKDVAVMGEEIQDMYKRYHDNDPEIFTELSNTITMHENMRQALEKNRRALKKAYFGRIDIKETGREQETFYIGKGGVMKDGITIVVIDWRAPIANVYYENGLGKCSYTAPEKQEITIELQKKRTYEVEEDRLIEYYDSEVVANDELLTKYLAKNKEAVLGEIIATIQKEQNEIIRKSPYRNLVVQGVAGSGKTTVAMHRISYILYNYGKDFRPEDFYIIGSNRILLNYITGVLPELDVRGVKQMTMEQLFIRLLYEDWKEKKYKVVSCGRRSFHKGTSEWFRKLEAFCLRLEESVIPHEDICFEEETLYSAEQVRQYRAENPALSVQSKIDALNAKVLARLKNRITGRDFEYMPEEKKQIIKEYSRKFGGKKWKQSIYELYELFLREQGELSSAKLQKELDIYDLAALAYLYKRVKETDPIREAHHIVIDEAQDFGMMVYRVLHFCIPRCTYTVMGDVSQNIHFGFGLNDWEELRQMLLTDALDSFRVLSKSYRNTVEISEFAQGILAKGSFRGYAIEPIIRHGNPVSVKKCAGEREIMSEAERVLTGWQKEGYDTIAVICRNEAEASYVAKKLAARIPIEESDLETAEFKSGIMVLPVDYTKGLEFDTVLLYNPTEESYPSDDGHAKLLYVAATRALHELVVLYTGEISGLLS